MYEGIIFVFVFIFVFMFLLIFLFAAACLIRTFEKEIWQVITSWAKGLMNVWRNYICICICICVCTYICICICILLVFIIVLLFVIRTFEKEIWRVITGWSKGLMMNVSKNWSSNASNASCISYWHSKDFAPSLENYNFYSFRIASSSIIEL